MASIANSTFSTSGLIAAIQRNALLPLNQATFETADLIAMMNEELETRIVPLILSARAGLFLKTVSTAIIPSNAVAISMGPPNSPGGDNVGYRIPSEAAGQRLNAVMFTNNAGQSLNLPQLDLDIVGAPYSMYAPGCFVMDETLYLFPASAFTAGGSYLTLYYFGRPLQLCDDTSSVDASTASSIAVTDVDYVTGHITCNPFLTLPASIQQDAEINFVLSTPGFQTLLTTVVTQQGDSTNDFYVDPAVLTDQYSRPVISPNTCWVANAGYSPFLQGPSECRTLVVQSTIAKILNALKDDRWQDAEKKYAQMATDVAKILSPRIDNSPKIITTAGKGIADAGRTWWMR